MIVRADAAGVVARRAALFREPPQVWVAEGRELVPAVADGADRARRRSRPSSPISIDLILDAGADPVVEHGVLTGEVAGLEVLRAVVDPYTGEPKLDVGLGNHDRDANQLVFGNVPPVSAIASSRRRACECIARSVLSRTR